MIPISLNEDWLLISRWITPIVYQPNILDPSGGANGLGDLNPTFFLSPANPGKLIWGIGPTFLLPTATEPTLGQGKWGAGPSVVLLASRSILREASRPLMYGLSAATDAGLW